MAYQQFDVSKVDYIEHIAPVKGWRATGVYKVHYKKARCKPYIEDFMTDEQYKNTIGRYLEKAEMTGKFVEYEIEDHGWGVEPRWIHKIYKIKEET